MITDIDFRAVLDTSGFDKSIKGLTNKLEPLQGRFAGVSKKMAAVGAAAGVAAAGIAMAVKGSLNVADEMGKAAAKFGVPVEELSKLNYAAGLADVSLEQLGTGLNKMNKLMVGAAEGNAKAKATFEQLGVSIQNQDGTMRASEAVFQDIADAISKMPDGAEKSALAMEVFGKAGANMIPLLNEGKTAIQAWGEEAQRAGLVISQETASAAETFNDNLTRLSGAVQGLSMTLAAALAPTLAAITEKIVEVVQWFQTLSPETQAYIGIAAAVGAALVPVVAVLGTFAIGLGALLSPIGLVVAAIALLAAGAITIYENWDGIVEYFDKLWNDIAIITQWAIQKIQDHWNNVIQFYVDLWDSIKQVFVDAWEGIKAIVVGWVEDFKALGGQIIDGLKAGILAKWEELKATITGMGDYISNAFKEALGIQSPSKVFHEFGGYIMEGLANGITDSAGLASDAVEDAANGLKDKTLEADTDLKAFGQTIGDTFKAFVTGSMDARTALQQLSQKLLEMATNQIFDSIFGNLFGGLFGGASAKGNVFNNGSMQKFANGGVVGGPTTFPMAGGKFGLMGEAGPEAIMPLTRGADGKLGVQSVGGSSGGGGIINNFNTTINAAPDQTEEDTRKMAAEFNRAIEGKIVEVMAKQRNSRIGGLR